MSAPPRGEKAASRACDIAGSRVRKVAQSGIREVFLAEIGEPSWPDALTASDVRKVAQVGSAFFGSTRGQRVGQGCRQPARRGLGYGRSGLGGQF
jgi:hypothetical protein